MALARALAERGWRLVLDARGATDLEAVADELSARTDVVAVLGDVGDEEADVVAAAAPHLGRFGCLERRRQLEVEAVDSEEAHAETGSSCVA